MYYANPINDFYMRPNQFSFPPQNQMQVNSRFVTSIEEAKAAMIDGFSTNVFLDSGNGKIYVKKLNNNGLSDFFIYSIEDNKTQDPFTEINTRLASIEKTLGGLIYDKSISSNASVQQSTEFNQSTVTEQNATDDEVQSTGFSKKCKK